MIEGKRGIPAKDPEYTRFQCGSNNIDVALCIFLGFALATCLVILYQVYYWNRFQHLQVLLSRNFFRSLASVKRTAEATKLNNNRKDSIFFGRVSLLPPKVRTKTQQSLETNDGRLTNSTKKLKKIIRDDLHAINFILLLSDLRAISIIFGVGSFLLLTPLYLILKLAPFHDSSSFATFENEYSWTASGVYMTGWEAAAVVCFIWTAMLVTVFLMYYHAFRRENSKQETALQQSAEKLLHPREMPPSGPPESASIRATAIVSRLSDICCDFSPETTSRRLSRIGLWLRLLARHLTIAFINCSLALSLNFFYVYYYQFKSLHPNELRSLQLFVSIGKLVLRRVTVDIKFLPFLRFGIGMHDLKFENELLVFLGVFNTIVAPFVATVLTERNCFYLAFKGTDPIHLTYKLPSLAIKDEYQTYAQGNGTSQNVFFQTQSTRLLAFIPPFIYYYQCSSSLVNIYAAPLIFAAIIKMFFFPVTSYVLRCVLDMLPASVEFCRRTQSGKPKPEGDPVHLLFRRSSVGETESAAGVDEEAKPQVGLREVLRFLLIRSMPKMLLTDSERDEHLVLQNSIWPRSFRSFCCLTSNDLYDENTIYFFDATSVLLDVFADIVILLTFGMLCPLLALVIIFAIGMRCTRYQYMVENILRGESEMSWEGLNLDCARAWRRQKNVLFRLRWMIVVLPSLFFTIFVYDIANSSYLEDGKERHIALALTCSVAIVPLVLSIFVTRFAPNCFANIARHVVRGEFGIELPSQKAEVVQNPLSSDGVELVHVVELASSSLAEIDLSDDHIRDTIPAWVDEDTIPAGCHIRDTIPAWVDEDTIPAGSTVPFASSTGNL